MPFIDNLSKLKRGIEGGKVDLLFSVLPGNVLSLQMINLLSLVKLVN